MKSVEKVNTVFSVFEFVEQMEPLTDFTVSLGAQAFKFKNLEGYSERNRIETEAKNFGKTARLEEFRKNLLDQVENPEHRDKCEKFIATRTGEDWALAFRIMELSIEPKLNALEAIMLTRVSTFVDNFNAEMMISSCKRLSEEFAKSVEQEKKDYEPMPSGS